MSPTMIVDGVGHEVWNNWKGGLREKEWKMKLLVKRVF